MMSNKDEQLTWHLNKHVGITYINKTSIKYPITLYPNQPKFV